MLGTLLYMAPEQFDGRRNGRPLRYLRLRRRVLRAAHRAASVHGADARVLMYKISFEEPPPIRALCRSARGLERVIRGFSTKIGNCGTRA